MVNIGIVGVGFMGVTHYKAMDKVKGGKVAALVSRDAKKRQGDWRSIQGNFGGGGGVQDLSRVNCYQTLDELLADPAIDLVDICLPTTMHVETSIRALAAGKHVLLEKPIAVNLRDADKIMAAAKKYRRQFFEIFTYDLKIVKVIILNLYALRRKQGMEQDYPCLKELNRKQTFGHFCSTIHNNYKGV